ncbi:MAG: hypothetical protein K1W22_06840 [Lachnospiraceae bacterium]
MDKDEVLRRVQQAQGQKPNQMDEMELDIFNRSCKIGIVTGLVACLVTMIVKIFAGVPYYDVYAIYCFMVGGQWFYRWVSLKKRRDLYYGILWCITAAGFFIGYLYEIF